MRIYIDEAGAFVAPRTQPHSFSLVLALIVPSASETELFYEFLRLRDHWPKQDIEIKGSSLDESQSAQVIDLLVRYDVLAEFVALEMATHPRQVIDDFKARQADAVTAHITPEHHPGIVSQLQNIARTIHGMPNQLFVQAFITIQLVLETIQNATLYFVQRQPKELGDIAWIIDRKNRTITQMEDTWTTLILPMSESHFAKTPLVALAEADYSHFDARYGFTAATVDDEMAQHLEWMRATYGPRQLTGEKSGIDAKLLLTEQRTFMDSRDSLGLQLADMLATVLRRALNDRLQLPGWKDFGRLLVRKGQPRLSFVQLGPGDAPIHLPKHAATVCRALDAQAKSMLAENPI